MRVSFFYYYNWPVDWGYRIHLLHLCRGIRLPRRVSWLWWWGSSNAVASENAEYPFIAIVWHYVGGPLSRRLLCQFWPERAWTRYLRRDRSGGGKAGTREARAVDKGTHKGELVKEPREFSWRGKTQRGSRRQTAEETPRRVIESRDSEEDRRDEFAVLSRQRSAVREDQSRSVGIPSSLVEKYTPALVNRCTGDAVSQNYPSCTWSWPKPILFDWSFFYHSLGCISCGPKEIRNTPADHYMNHQPRLEMVLRSWCIGGWPTGCCHNRSQVLSGPKWSIMTLSYL